MEELYLKLKSTYGQAKIIQVSSNLIEVDFKNSKETIIIQKGTVPNRFTVFYPQLLVQHNGKQREEYSSFTDIMMEGLFWILKQIKKHGKVLPNF